MATRRPRGSKSTLLVLVAFVAIVGSACDRGRETASGSVVSHATTSLPSLSTASPDGSVPGTMPRPVSIKLAVTPAAATIHDVLTTPDGRERSYHLYVPKSVGSGGPLPLLVALHGGFGRGVQFEENSGFDGLAEANQFIVVYPDGISIVGNVDSRVWNGGGCCGPAQQEKQNVDDVTFISMLIDHLASTQPVDRNRVYATGHSNGAIMSYRLACELSDKIAGIAVQAGTLFVEKCTPTRPVSVLEIHGDADENVPINGGQGKGFSKADFPSPLVGVKKLAAHDRCPPDARGTQDPANADVTTQIWQPCDAGTAVEFITVHSANHAWMGHAGASKASKALVGDPYLGYDSSLAVWTFLASHSRR